MATAEKTVSEWARKLKELRARLGITQREAAEKLGVHIQTWKNWEYGRREPTAGTRQAIRVTFRIR